MSRRRWRILSSRLIVDVQWYKLRKDRVLWPDNSEVDYYVSVRPDVVVICPLLADSKLLLVEQYKHAVATRTLELPAGLVKSKERPLAAARRELLEEAGCQSKKWMKIGWLFDDSSKNSNRVHIYLALDAQQTGKPTPEPGERAACLRIHMTDLKGAIEMIRRGRIVSQSSVVALFMCIDALRSGNVAP